MAKSTRSTATASAMAMAGGVGRDPGAIAMIGGTQLPNLSTWDFLWFGITVPIGFYPVAVPPPPPPPEP